MTVGASSGHRPVNGDDLDQFKSPPVDFLTSDRKYQHFQCLEDIGTPLALAFAGPCGPLNTAEKQPRHKGETKAMTSIDPGRLLQMRSAILNQNSALQRAAGHDAAGAAGGVGKSNGAQGGGFGATMVDALKAVNEQQATANTITDAYERGQTSDLVQVMVERQKASVGFEATLQVRNKLLSAYRDIMNMPV